MEKIFLCKASVLHVIYCIKKAGLRPAILFLMESIQKLRIDM